jgi:hypothetical protein
MLAVDGARGFYEGQVVGTVDYSNERMKDHHVFPSQARGLPPETSKTFGGLKDCILNRTLLLNETNNRIKNRRPSQYIVDMIEKHGSEEKVKDILRGHFITDEAYEAMKKDEFDNFIAAREAAMRKHIASRLGRPSQEGCRA